MIERCLPLIRVRQIRIDKMSKNQVLEPLALDVLFREARTYYSWQNKPVGDDIIRQVFDLAKMGPTSANCSPLRLVVVKSPEAKEKLKPLLDKGNVDKTMSAPATIIFAHDRKFYEFLPKLFPHTNAKSWFEGNPDLIEQTMWRNGTLQAGYFILAARALGLDCGPMSGFNKQKTKEVFFPDLDGEVNFLCNIGYGDPSGLHPRSPRFDFDEVGKFV